MNVGSVQNTTVKFQGMAGQVQNNNDEFLKFIAQDQAFKTGGALSQPSTDTVETSNTETPKKKGGFFGKFLAVVSIGAGLAAAGTIGAALWKTGGKFGEAGELMSKWGSDLWAKVKSVFPGAQGI